MIHKRRIALTTLVSLLSEFANKIFPLFVLHHAQKVLGLVNFGYAQSGISLFEVLIPIVSFGFSTLGTIKFTSEPGGRSTARGLLGSILVWRTLFAFLTFLAIVLMIETDEQFAANSAIIYGGCFVLFTSAIDFDFVFVATQRLMSITSVLIAVKLLSATAIILLVDSPNDAVLYTMLFLGGNACVSLVGFVAVASRIGLSFPSRAQLVAVFQQALPYALTPIILLSGERIDILLAGRFLGGVGAGLYAVPARLVGSLTNMAAAIGRVFFSELVAKNDIEHFTKLVRLEVFSVAALLLPIAVGTWFVGQDVLTTFFGEVYQDQGPLFSVLALGAVFYMAIHLFGHQILVLKEQIAFVNVTMTVGFVLSILCAVGLAWVLAPEYALLGIASGIVFGKACTAAVLSVRCRTYLSSFPWREILRPLVAAAIMACILAVTDISSWYLRVVVGAVAYGLVLSFLSRSELGALVSKLRQRRAG